MTTSDRTTAPLAEAPTCDHCHAPDAVLYARHDNGTSDFLCPACLPLMARQDAALAHLEMLLESAVTDWLTVWQGEGVKLHDYPTMIAAEIEQKHASGLLVARPRSAAD